MLNVNTLRLKNEDPDCRILDSVDQISLANRDNDIAFKSLSAESLNLFRQFSKMIVSTI